MKYFLSFSQTVDVNRPLRILVHCCWFRFHNRSMWTALINVLKLFYFVRWHVIHSTTSSVSKPKLCFVHTDVCSRGFVLFCPRTHENWVQHPMDARTQLSNTNTYACISTHAHVGVNEALHSVFDIYPRHLFSQNRDVGKQRQLV